MRNLHFKVLLGEGVTIAVPGWPDIRLVVQRAGKTRVRLHFEAPVEVSVLRQTAVKRQPKPTAVSGATGTLIAWRPSHDDAASTEPMRACADLAAALAALDEVKTLAEARHPGHGCLVILNARGDVCWHERIRPAIRAFQPNRRRA